MTSEHRKPAAPPAADSTGDEGEYKGPERRRRPSDEVEVRHEVRFDAKGNPVWEVRVDSPRRRKDDDTFNLLKCLDTEDLSLEVEDEDDADEDSGTGAYLLYNRDPER